MTFDANLFNYGSATQTNVALEVEIRDANNAQADDINWFSFFNGSLIFNAPHCRVVLAYASDISLNESELANFSVYPNPSTGNGFIEFSQPGTYSIKVHSMLGDAVYSQTTSVNANEKVQLELGHMPNGVYLITINNGGKASKSIKLTINN